MNNSKKPMKPTEQNSQYTIRQSPLEQIVELILAEVKTEKIFLLNSLGYEHVKDVSFLTNLHGAYVYHILIIIKGSTRPFDEIRISIKEKYMGVTPVNLITWSAPHFKKQLGKMDPTATKYNEACVLYDAGDERRSWPGVEQLTETDHWLNRMQDDITQYYSVGLEFLLSAEAHLQVKSYRTAAFSLHQCMEYFLAATCMIVTGYRAMVHNINELHKFATSFLPEMSIMLPHHHERQRRIHAIIYNAYISKKKMIPEVELFAMVTDLHNINAVLRGVLLGCGR